MLWGGTIVAATASLGATLFKGADRRTFLPGATTHGHYQIEMACAECHTPFEGVKDDACLRCHSRELQEARDSHPASKFTDPRNADRLLKLDALRCVTCHREHDLASTHGPGVTQPRDYCLHCHDDIGEQRPTHRGAAFTGCATAGCHNYHDNRVLHIDWLSRHLREDFAAGPGTVLPRRPKVSGARPLAIGDADAPPDRPVSLETLQDWEGTRHARAGVNCRACHAAGGSAWSDRPGFQACRSCHGAETDGWLSGHHGMRATSGLSPMTPGQARLSMNPAFRTVELTCSSCHGAHRFDSKRAALDACLRCHADDHSLAYRGSPHHATWAAEQTGEAAAGTGVSCATCHLPRETHAVDGEETTVVVHNPNHNLRPRTKMVREVCQSCHGLGFALAAIADESLIRSNFRGRPRGSLDTLDWARRFLESSSGRRPVEDIERRR